jgi:hypothetical protein
LVLIKRLLYAYLTPALRLLHTNLVLIKRLCYTCFTPALHLLNTNFVLIKGLRYACFTPALRLLHTGLIRRELEGAICTSLFTPAHVLSTLLNACATLALRLP